MGQLHSLSRYDIKHASVLYECPGIHLLVFKILNAELASILIITVVEYRNADNTVFVKSMTFYIASLGRGYNFQ